MEQHHTDKTLWSGITLFSIFQLILNFSLGILWKEISKCICSIFPGKEVKISINTLDHSLSVLENCWTMFLPYQYQEAGPQVFQNNYVYEAASQHLY